MCVWVGLGMEIVGMESVWMEIVWTETVGSVRDLGMEMEIVGRGTETEIVGRGTETEIVGRGTETEIGGIVCVGLGSEREGTERLMLMPMGTAVTHEAAAKAETARKRVETILNWIESLREFGWMKSLQVADCC